ncbi:MAG: type I 3-dehydroquinate dehydratase, partial [Polyangiaceae bacterium]|nr:type I 3-dehydroquinate dehydratase [Polyangiaceae bacterium]
MTDQQLRAKFCVSVAVGDVSGCVDALRGEALAEVRLDAMAGVSEHEIASIFSLPLRLVATCRRTAEVSDTERARRLRAAVRAGASYVDVELDADGSLREQLVGTARGCGCQVIVSHHDYAATPEARVLRELLEACYEAGADVAKIACE